MGAGCSSVAKSLWTRCSGYAEDTQQFAKQFSNDVDEFNNSVWLYVLMLAFAGSILETARSIRDAIYPPGESAWERVAIDLTFDAILAIILIVLYHSVRNARVRKAAASGSCADKRNIATVQYADAEEMKSDLSRDEEEMRMLQNRMNQIQLRRRNGGGVSPQEVNLVGLAYSNVKPYKNISNIRPPDAEYTRAVSFAQGQGGNVSNGTLLDDINYANQQRAMQQQQQQPFLSEQQQQQQASTSQQQQQQARQATMDLPAINGGRYKSPI